MGKKKQKEGPTPSGDQAAAGPSTPHQGGGDAPPAQQPQQRAEEGGRPHYGQGDAPALSPQQQHPQQAQGRGRGRGQKQQHPQQQQQQQRPGGDYQQGQQHPAQGQAWQQQHPAQGQTRQQQHPAQGQARQQQHPAQGQAQQQQHPGQGQPQQQFYQQQQQQQAWGRGPQQQQQGPQQWQQPPQQHPQMQSPQGPPQQGGRGRGGRGGHPQQYQAPGQRPPYHQQQQQQQQYPQQQRQHGREGQQPQQQQQQYPRPPPSQQQFQTPPPPQEEQIPAAAAAAAKQTPPVAEIEKGVRTLTTAEKAKEPRKEQDLPLALAHRAVRNSGGKSGRPILITTNHFTLNLGKLERAVHYDVNIDPDMPKKAMRPVMEAFRRKHYPNRFPAFDGAKNLYSSSELPFGDQLRDENVVIRLEDRDKTYKVTVKFAAYVDLSSLRTYFSARSENGDHLVTPQDAIQCIDIVLRSAPAITCIPAGRSFFTKPRGEIIRLGDGMELYYGFYQSAVLGWKPFLNVDVAHKAFPISQPIPDLIMELYRMDEGGLQRPDVRDRWEQLRTFITTLKVTYEIPGQPTSKRMYSVNGLGGSPRQETFTPEGQASKTIFDYFRVDKRYTLRFPELPCLWVGNRERKPRILLPAELCKIVEGQAIRRKMNEIQTSNMIKRAATNTHIRKDKIMAAVQGANYNRNESVREFGFAVGGEFEQVNARILQPPALLYNNSERVMPGKGVWDASKSRFRVSAQLKKWTIGCLDRRTNMDALNRLAGMVQQQGGRMGMAVERPQPFQTFQPRRGQEIAELSRFFAERKDYDLIIMIIPDFGSFYAYVKQAAELSVGCLTQCIKARTMYRSLNPATVGNILLKVNAKLNGLNHCLSETPNCLKFPCMIMGADVTHPSPESRGTTPSVAAVTASHDLIACKYNICWRLQEPRLEIIEDLENIVHEQLMFFHRANPQQKPQHIIFFRDGVSEGQFKEVMNSEVQAIRRACSRLENQTYKPKITFLVVQKRHHTRFFPTNPRDSHDKNFNVPAGTCVDTTITHPTAQDFYLVSHASIQGVAKPTKYRTLWDDADMSEDEIEQLTYFLCHLFTRCNRSVSYPAPTYYAHLAAARAKVYCDERRLNMGNLAREQSQIQIKEMLVKGKPMFFV